MAWPLPSESTLSISSLLQPPNPLRSPARRLPSELPSLHPMPMWPPERPPCRACLLRAPHTEGYWMALGLEGASRNSTGMAGSTSPTTWRVVGLICDSESATLGLSETAFRGPVEPCLALHMRCRTWGLPVSLATSAHMPSSHESQNRSPPHPLSHIHTPPTPGSTPNRPGTFARTSTPPSPSSRARRSRSRLPCSTSTSSALTRPRERTSA